MEVWKTIPEFPNYEMNEKGQIKNQHTGRLLKIRRNNGGHPIVQLYNGFGYGYCRSVNKIFRQLYGHNLEGHKASAIKFRDEITGLDYKSIQDFARKCDESYMRAFRIVRKRNTGRYTVLEK